MTNPIEAIAQSLEAFDARLSNIEKRFVAVEGHLADDARASDELAKSHQKLAELYVSIDGRLESVQAMLGNYVDETKRLRLTSQNLISEVREKLKAV
jgi:hypothetical protein